MDCTQETYKAAKLLADWFHLWEWQKLGRRMRLVGLYDFWHVLIAANFTLETAKGVIDSALDILGQIWEHLPDGAVATATPRGPNGESCEDHDAEREASKIKQPLRFAFSGCTRDEFLVALAGKPEKYSINAMDGKAAQQMLNLPFWFYGKHQVASSRAWPPSFRSGPPERG
jgi:hypothetical protein